MGNFPMVGTFGRTRGDHETTYFIDGDKTQRAIGMRTEGDGNAGVLVLPVGRTKRAELSSLFILSEQYRFQRDAQSTA